jgi:hypothetical protein
MKEKKAADSNCQNLYEVAWNLLNALLGWGAD